MTVTSSDPKRKVMHISGKDYAGLLLRVARATTATQIDIIECLAHTNGNQAVIVLELAGSEGAFRELMKTRHIKDVLGDGYQVLLNDMKDQTYDEPMMSVLYRLRVVAPHFIGLLKILTEFLLERGIHAESHHGTQYQPPRAHELASLQVFTIRIPKSLDMELLHEDLQELATDHGFWELKIELV